MLIDLSDKNLSESESAQVEALLKKQDPHIKNDLEQMWYLLDMVWDEYGCNNRQPDWDTITEYYSHPVWLLNGLFIEQDRQSTIHRQSIAVYIKNIDAGEVIDYGGGFGTLARTISDKCKQTDVFIYEPYPSEYGLRRLSGYENIAVIDELRKDTECLVSTDVLEHLDNPLEVLHEMIKSVKIGGVMLIAAPFYPMIKCHLPKHFHFRYTLRFFCMLMGLKKTGTLPDAPHVSIYKKEKDKKPNWPLIKALVAASKTFFAITEPIKPLARLFIK